jgi:S1-C subfamily serine protease
VSETADAPAPTTTRRRTRTVAIGTLGALGIAASAVFGVQAATGSTTAVQAIAAPVTDPTVAFGGRGGYAWNPGPSGGYGSTTTPGSSTSATVPAATEATADQLVGVVDITTVLGYQNGEAAGTGMVLTANGEILTNNHVVDGATSITVTVLSTGQSYPATVVGTDPTDDVAVLQLTGASGLDTVQIDSSTVAVGDAVTAVGNAGGATDSTSAAAGTVTGLDQSITATDESRQNAEDLGPVTPAARSTTPRARSPAWTPPPPAAAGRPTPSRSGPRCRSPSRSSPASTTPRSTRATRPSSGSRC